MWSFSIVAAALMAAVTSSPVPEGNTNLFIDLGYARFKGVSNSR